MSSEPDSALTVMLAMNDASRDRVLVPRVRARLDAVATVLPVGPGTSFLADPAIRAALPEVDVLLTGWGSPRIGPEVLDAAPKLRAILHAAGSVKAIVDPAAFDRGIQVSSAATANALPVAEFTVAAIVLAGKRAFRLAAQYRIERRKADPHGMPGSYGTTVGLLGASRIARMVAERLRGFDLHVLISDPY
ncbi:MAG TPA: NAD(P)-dependent oxidoreductase, partial [Kribbella sp.]|nr:NAD(P)-dependent oxidoreductase [Kribbella sp.]